MKLSSSVSMMALLRLLLTTAAQTSAPTASPTSAPTISLEDKYFIALIENSTTATFNDTDSNNEIMFNLKITDDSIMDAGFGDHSVTVLNYDTCDGDTFAESVVSAVPDLGNKIIDGIYAEVPILVDINTTDIENIGSGYPGYFTAENDTVVLKFCVLSELGRSQIYNSTSGTEFTTSISYSKVKVEVDIDMKKGFQSASVAVKEDSPEEEVADTSISYELSACECDDDGDCIDSASLVTKTQNSMINICIYTPDSNDVIISEIKDMRIFSDEIEYNAISESKANAITLTKSIDSGKKQVVSTRLVAAFFTDLGEGVTSSVDIDGTALMEFAASSPAGGSPSRVRKLVRVGSVGGSKNNKKGEIEENTKNEEMIIGMKAENINNGRGRTLDENAPPSGAGLGSFGMELGISKESLGAVSASSASDDGKLSLAATVLQSLVMGGVALLVM